MKIISWNVNGLRAVERKHELSKMIETYNPDILFIQETKATADQLSEIIMYYGQYHQHYNSAKKAGYAGTGLWVRKTLNINYTYNTNMTNWNDDEGRISTLETNKHQISGIYFPNGGKSNEAWLGKLDFYKNWLKHINNKRETGKQIIWCGDINVAHNEIDLARPKENNGKIGFHPNERNWVNKVIENNWTDIYRHTHPNKKEAYTWWAMRTAARERNIGWRLDYFFLDTPDLTKTKQIKHLTEQTGSDHCPILLEIDIDFT